MVSSYTTNKNLEKPGNGDYVDTWNVPLNSDMNVIDAAFGGVTSLNATSGSAILSVNQYQNLTLSITGAISASVTYTIPSGVGGSWLVRNATTDATGGPWDVIIASGGGGDSVTCIRGKTINVYSDGTNIRAVQENIFSAGTVTSVNVSGGTTGLTTSGGPVTTSGTITLAGTLGTANGGTNLTSFTSGGAVYATSTSALTTGTLPTASGGTGLASYAVGDILYASGTTTIGKLSDVAVGSVLVSGGVNTAPAYSTDPVIKTVTYNGSTSGSIVLQATAIAGTNTLTLPAATGTLIYGTQPSGAIVGTTDTQTLTNKTLTGAKLTAGTNSVAPLTFNSGTKLTSAAAGSMEYDGKVPYITPQGSQRGVVPGMQFFRLNADLVGANVNTAQNIFGVGVTLSSSTVYAFQCFYIVSKSAGTTSHNFSIGYGGTATLNNILYGGVWNNAGAVFASGTNTSANNVSANTASNVAIITGATSAQRYIEFYLQGTVSVNAGGTFIPQYTLSAAPGGAYTTIGGSYFLIYPISTSGANTSVGTWA